MTYIQKATPPPNKVETFSLKSFVGGLKNNSEQLLENQATDIINMMFADETVMETRYGQKYHDEVTLDGEIVFIDEYKPYSDTDKIIKATASKLYMNNVFLTNIASKPSGTNHMGKYFFCDGDKIYVYGKFAQVTSTYDKVIGTPINDYVLMEVVSPASGHARLGTEHVRGVLNIDYTNHKVFYEPCENEFIDTFSGANVVPDDVKFVVSHKGRLFASGNGKDDDNVFITDMQNPFYFPVSLPLQIPPNSDKIVGMIVYDDSVVLGRTSDIYVISGNTNRTDVNAEQFRLRKLNTHTGFANGDVVDVAHNYLFFFGNDGNAYSLSSVKNDEKVLSTTLISRDIAITKEPINVTLDDVRNATSIFHNNEWVVSIKDKVLVYSYIHRAWTMYNKLNTKVFYKHNDVLIWGKVNGRVAEWDKEVFLDFGEPYESHWYSKRYDMGEANAFKQFREFFVVTHSYDDYLSDVRVVFEIDYSDVKDKYVVSDQISRWGYAKFGDRFINRNINESIPFVIGRRGRNIRFKLISGHDVDVTVATYAELEDLLGRREDMFAYVTGENKYYIFTNRQWVNVETGVLNQRMKVYQVNGDYEMRGKR